MTEVSNNKSESQVTVASVNEAVAQAGGIQPKLTAKQQEKQDKKEKAYWNGMVSRAELSHWIQEMEKESTRKLQTLYIQNATILDVLLTKGIITEADMEVSSKKIIKEFYGELPEGDTLEDSLAEASKAEVPTDEQN